MQRDTDASTLEPFAEKLAYRAELSPGDKAAIMALPFARRDLKRHEYIVRQRDVATHSTVMLAGVSIRSKVVAEGARQILAVHMKGEAVDLQNSLLRIADHSVQMLTNGSVASIPRDAVIELARDRPRVGHAMWVDTLVDAAIFREWIANVGRRAASARIAHLLCEFAIRLRSAGLANEHGYEIPMTQEEIADATGLTSVHVNRTLKALDGEGVITRVPPRSIRIADWRALARTADFDAGYLHMREDDAAFP